MGVVIVEEKGKVLGVNLGCPIVPMEHLLCDALFSNYFEDLFCMHKVSGI